MNQARMIILGPAEVDGAIGRYEFELHYPYCAQEQNWDMKDSYTASNFSMKAPYIFFLTTTAGVIVIIATSKK